jgi:putative nucleotidyltransferase with HDIG domain
MSTDAAHSAEVQDTINRFIAVILKDLKSNCLKLPTLPSVAMRVREAVESDNSSTVQIARLISADAALSARLIRVANSPLYRGRTPIESVPMAVTRLGTRTVRDLVVSLIMQQLFQTRSPMLRAHMERLWLHSTEVAALSSLLARRFTSLSVDEAMLAGLLHDIGALPLIVRAEEFPVLLGNEAALDQVIEQLHTQIGKLILETWQFPPGICAAAGEHEQLDRYSAEVDYVDVVIVANLHSYMGTTHRLAKVSWGDIPAFGKLGLRPEESVAVLEETRAEREELKKLLQG